MSQGVRAASMQITVICFRHCRSILFSMSLQRTAGWEYGLLGAPSGGGAVCSLRRGGRPLPHQDPHTAHNPTHDRGCGGRQQPTGATARAAGPRAMSTGMAQSANTLSLSTTRSHVRYPRAAGAGEHDASAVKVCTHPQPLPLPAPSQPTTPCCSHPRRGVPSFQRLTARCPCATATPLR